MSVASSKSAALEVSWAISLFSNKPELLSIPKSGIFFFTFVHFPIATLMNSAVPATAPSTDKILSRIRASLSLGLLGAESFQSLMDSNSGDLDELRRLAASLVTALNLIEDRASSLDMSDPNLIVPREIVSELALQATTGEANISEWLSSRKTAAKHAIEVGVSQSNALGAMTSHIEQLLLG